MNINILIGKWMPCDALWVLGKKKGEFYLKRTETEKYYLEEYNKTMLIPTLLIPPLIERVYIHGNPHVIDKKKS
jgi:hypothetical protein